MNGTRSAAARAVAAVLAAGLALGLAACGTGSGTATGTPGGSGVTTGPTATATSAPSSTSSATATPTTTTPSPTATTPGEPSNEPTSEPSSEPSTPPATTPATRPSTPSTHTTKPASVPAGDPACPASSGVARVHAPEVAGYTRTVALTFDDGPGPATPAILDVLAAEGVPATFFVVGGRAAVQPSLVRREAADGHLVADHSWDHLYPWQVPGGWTQTHVEDQIHRTATVLSDLTGRPTCWFRPPGGITTNVAGASVRQRVRVVLWQVDPKDWQTSQSAVTLTAAAKGILARATAVDPADPADQHPIVLLHDGGGDRGATAAALPGIIAWYRSHGYTFVRVDGVTR